MNPHLAQKTQLYLQRLKENMPQSSADQAVSKQIQTLLGLSDFVAENLISEPGLIEPLNAALAQPEEQPDYQQLLAQACGQINDEPELMRTLRRFRQRHMSCIAAKDLLNLQPIEQSLQQVSALADGLINSAYHWLYQQFTQKYGTPEGEHGPQPLLILGMGKLGGRELNFSSDIDLIFCYPTNGEVSGGRKSIEHRQFFTRLAQRLIHVLDHIDQHGQVFRVDMRLRPLGDSGPLVMHMDAFEDYYQEQGREWERYAMLKARVINDQSEYTEQLMAILTAFVYRRYIDYSVIDSLRDMKSMINHEVRRRGLHDNVKLGAGGIREVEFIAQSFQLIKGGREPELQLTSLLQTLETLHAVELLEQSDSQRLTASYLYLRKIEHCLQQFNDEQTQQLPQEPLNQQRLAMVMGEADYAQVRQQISEHMAYIHAQFQMLIGQSPNDAPESVDEDLELLQDLWQLPLNPDEMAALLEKRQQSVDSQAIAAQLIEFKQRVDKKHPSSRGLQALQHLMPQLLAYAFSLTDEPQPQTTAAQLLDRIFNVLTPILLRTTYLQLLVESHGAQQQLVKLCFASPWIAEHISKYPILLDELLNPLHLYNPTQLGEYHPELRQFMLRVDPDDLELQMESLRQFKQIQQLKIAAADVTGVLPVMQVSDHLTYLAEALIQEVVNMAWYQMKQKYGVPSGTSDDNKQFAVLGYGKLGGIELGYGSDLDLVFLHNCDAEARTDGRKSLETNQFYTKFAQRIMHLFMTKTPAGQLYEVDMRLRPSGNAGLLVCHLNGYQQYQQEQAWTWEHQAMVRARVVCSPAHLWQEIGAIRQQILAQKRPLAALQKDVVAMRQKMRDHLNRGDANWLDVKQGKGAIADIEFLVQYWVLAHTHQHPELSKWSDNVRILEQLAQLALIDQHTQRTLCEAYLDYRNYSHRLTLLERDKLVSRDLFVQHQQQVKQIWNMTFGLTD